MRPVSDAARDIIDSSRRGDQIVAYVWRDGQLAHPNPLPLGDWTITWDAERQVQAQGTVSIADSSGRLAPWGLDDPLGIAGSELQLTYMVGGREAVNLGWYPITGNVPDESWRLYGDSLWVSGGAKITVEIDDRTVAAAEDLFLAPEEVSAGGTTALAEVRRILSGIVPVYATGSALGGLRPAATYNSSRMDAVDDLLTTSGCVHRMDGDGVMEVLTSTPTDPVWTLHPGDGGTLVRLARAQRRSNLRNAVVVRGSAEDGRPIQGVAMILTGPLRYRAGLRLAEIVQDSFATTDADVSARAQEILASQSANLSQPVSVTCPPNPALQVHDYVQVTAPLASGGTTELSARVKSITLRSTNGAVQPMTIEADVSYADLQAVRG